MLEGALIALAAFLLGRLLPGRRKGLRSPKPVCGCHHHHSYHDPATGHCHSTSTSNGLKCPCRAYSGPVPLPEVYAPEIGS